MRSYFGLHFNLRTMEGSCIWAERLECSTLSRCLLWLFYIDQERHIPTWTSAVPEAKSSQWCIPKPSLDRPIRPHVTNTANAAFSPALEGRPAWSQEQGLPIVITGVQEALASARQEHLHIHHGASETTHQRNVKGRARKHSAAHRLGPPGEPRPGPQFVLR